MRGARGSASADEWRCTWCEVAIGRRVLAVTGVENCCCRAAGKVFLARDAGRCGVVGVLHGSRWELMVLEMLSKEKTVTLVVLPPGSCESVSDDSVYKCDYIHLRTPGAAL